MSRCHRVKQHPITMATRVNGLVKVALVTCLVLVWMSGASEARRRTEVVATATSDNLANPSLSTDISPTSVRKRASASKTATAKPRPVKGQKPRPSDGQKPVASVNEEAVSDCTGKQGVLRPLGLWPTRTATTILTRTVTAFYPNPTLTPVANTHLTLTHTVRSTYTSHMIVPTISTSTNVVVTASYSTIVLPVFSTTTIVLPRTMCI